jgi:hypothetical protein
MRKLRRFAVIAVAAVALLALGSQASMRDAEATQTVVNWPTAAPGYWQVNAFTEYTNGIAVGVQMPCYDCYITGVTPDLEYDSDPGGGFTWTQANYSTGAMLHHMVLFNHNLVDPTCAHDPVFSQLGDRFFASGDERGSLTFAPGFGYYIPPSDGGATNYWNLNVMIHNLSPTQKNFRLKMTFNWEPASANLKSMRHIWLDVGNCVSSEYPVATGYDDEHWTWTSGQAAGTADDIEGKILGMGGHVHDWGVSVSATKGTLPTSPVICSAVGGYAVGSQFAPDPVGSPPAPAAAHPANNIDHNPGDPTYNGHIESMSGCTPNMLLAVGDTVQLHAQYNTDGPIDDVMGIMNAWIYDNCPTVTNPGQEDLFDADDFGDACDVDLDGDGVCDNGATGPGGFSCTGTDADDDNDGYSDVAEAGAPLCVGTTNDDNLDDSSVNDGCPAVGPAESNCADAVDNDVDMFVNDGCGQVNSASEATNLGTSKSGRCHVGTASPSTHWPSDFSSGGIPNSTDRLTITDLTSYTSLPRKFGTSPPDANFNARWDLTPGKGILASWINLNDILALTSMGPTGYPPMFGGSIRAFNGPQCQAP